MKTIILELSGYRETGTLSPADEEKLKQGAEILRSGGLLAFPTETVYGLGGNALLKAASKNIYAAKGRPSDNPLIVHISELSELSPVVKEIPARARILAEKFWPGPLTMILEKSEIVPPETTGGLPTVAVRMPEHAVARRLIKLAGIPVAAPSANTSGKPSPTCAEHVIEDLNGKIDCIIDGGAAGIGLESTIVDVSGGEAVLLRPGAVTRAMLSEALGEEVALDPALEKPLEKDVHPKAPGMKYRHYAPKAPMLLIQEKPAEGLTAGGEKAEKRTDAGIWKTEETSGYAALNCREARLSAAVIAAADEKLAEGKRVGLLCSEETYPLYESHYRGKENLLLDCIGSRRAEQSIAHNLFSALRKMDKNGAEFIVAEGVPEERLGYAIMNRLKKAAAQNILYV